MKTVQWRRRLISDKLLGRLPREELDRVDTKILDKYYKPSEEE